MFIDTNILVQARAQLGPHHAIAASALARAKNSGERVCISRQIIREYLAAVTRPQSWSAPLTMSEALADVERFAAEFTILEDGPGVMERLVALCRDVPVGGRQIHDANIVATMLAHDEQRLLTLNAADFRRYAGWIAAAAN